MIDASLFGIGAALFIVLYVRLTDGDWPWTKR